MIRRRRPAACRRGLGDDDEALSTTSGLRRRDPYLIDRSRSDPSSRWWHVLLTSAVKES